MMKDFAEAGSKPEVQPPILKENAMRPLGLGASLPVVGPPAAP